MFLHTQYSSRSRSSRKWSVRVFLCGYVTRAFTCFPLSRACMHMYASPRTQRKPRRKLCRQRSQAPCTLQSRKQHTRTVLPQLCTSPLSPFHPPSPSLLHHLPPSPGVNPQQGEEGMRQKQHQTTRGRCSSQQRELSYPSQPSTSG